MSLRTFHGLAAASILPLFPLLFGSAPALAADFRWVQDPHSCAPPEYPRESLKNGEQGTTVLRILVGVDGKAIDSEVEASSHSRKLDAAAQRALMQCSFKPAAAGAKPEQAWVQTQFVWKLG